MPTDNETAVRRFYEALACGDTELVDGALAPGWEAVPALHTGPGPDGWKKTVEHLSGVLSGLAVTVEHLVASGDMVAVRSVARGLHTGPLLGVEGTGREVELRASDFHQLAGGLIVRTWHLEDYFGLAGRLGLELTRGA
ncbi:ester cyclase [Streptomyces sp. NPDC047002]|uniref:ester cyclase n=1 Tax=Streptomyces sp. NPDC047002 TaxID=3155475 RepID=UPI0034572309